MKWKRGRGPHPKTRSKDFAKDPGILLQGPSVCILPPECSIERPIWVLSKDEVLAAQCERPPHIAQYLVEIVSQRYFLCAGRVGWSNGRIAEIVSC